MQHLHTDILNILAIPKSLRLQGLSTINRWGSSNAACCVVYAWYKNFNLIYCVTHDGANTLVLYVLHLDWASLEWQIKTLAQLQTLIALEPQGLMDFQNINSIFLPPHLGKSGESFKSDGVSNQVECHSGEFLHSRDTCQRNYYVLVVIMTVGLNTRQNWDLSTVVCLCVVKLDKRKSQKTYPTPQTAQILQRLWVEKAYSLLADPLKVLPAR